MEVNFDAIVVGSGPCGVHAAQTLLEKNLKVAILDVGHKNDISTHQFQESDFISFRTNNNSQHELLLGPDYRYLSFKNIETAAHLTPPRSFIVRDVQTLVPFEGGDFRPLQSVALGGLGSGWGAGCYVFSDAELSRVGLDVAAMQDAYEVVAKRIGISALRDEAGRYSIGQLKNILPPLGMDRLSTNLYQRYLKKKDRLKEKGFTLGRTPLAVLSESYSGRPAYRYHDMDFWLNDDDSYYRPELTLRQLKASSHFAYLDGYLATSFSERDNHVQLDVVQIHSKRAESFRCRKLLLAGGALNSARIALRSVAQPGHKTSLLCNPYVYIPCIDLRALGTVPEARKSSLSQLSLFYDDAFQNSSISVGSFYTYRSLLLFKLAQEIPLNVRDARRLAHYLQSSLVIVGLHFAEQFGDEKFISLQKDEASMTGDKLVGRYRISAAEKANQKTVLRKFLKALWTMGLVPIKTVDPGRGSSIHYGGTIPLDENRGPLSVHADGRLKSQRNVYVADGSSFRFLPAKGLTFTLMANAHRIAGNAFA